MAITTEYYWNNYSEFTVTSANSFTTVGTVPDDGSQYWELDFIAKGFVQDQIYRFDLDYIKTNDSLIEFSVLQNSTGNHEPIVWDNVTDNEGHVTLTFKAEEHNCHNGEIVFGVGGLLSNNVTVTNVTFTEGRWLDYAVDYNSNANVSQISPHEFLVTASSNWEIDLLLTNLTANETYYVTYYYEHDGDGNLYHKVTESTEPYTILAGGVDYTNEFKNKKGDKIIEFVPTTTTAYFCLYGDGGDFTQKVMIQKFKVSTEPPVHEKVKERVMTIKENKVYLDEDYEHYLGGLNIKKVEIDKYGDESIQLDNEGTLHCAYVTDYDDLLKTGAVSGVSGLTDHWHYVTSSFDFIGEGSIDYTVLGNNWGNEFYLPVKADKKYRLEYDLYNGTGKELFSTVKSEDGTIRGERYSTSYLTSCHITHEFLSSGNEYWILCDWAGDDVALDASKQVKVRNFKLVELVDDYILGVLNHYWGGGTDSFADWYLNENASGVTVIGKRGYQFSTGVDFYRSSTILEKDTRYMCSFDFELSDAFKNQKDAWVGCSFSYWSTDVNEIIDLSGLIQLTDGNDRLKGHVETKNFITPTDSGNFYVKVEGGNARYYNSWIKITNLKVFTKIYNNRSLYDWWSADGMEVDFTEPDTYILTRNPESLTTNLGEIAHKLYGFKQGANYTFEADVEYAVPVEPVYYMSNYFRITDGNNGDTTLAEEQFIIRNGEPLTETKHVTYNFTSSSDIIGIYCSSWVENDDIDKGFTLKMTNVKITKN